MKRPIDHFKNKSKEEIYEKDDRLAMFLAAMKVFMPPVLLILLLFTSLIFFF